jgi:hypothetical protein
MNAVDLGGMAFSGIALASIGTALLALLVVRRWSDHDRIARVKAQAHAHLLELRLFMDEPAQILRSHWALVVDNARMLRLLLPSLLILAVPMVLVLWGLDAMYGRAPLRVGEPAVVSTESRYNSISTPDGVIVETKPLFIQATGQRSWRIRPVRSASGIVTAGSGQRRIVAGSEIAYLPEPLVGASPIQIGYPRATVFGVHWLVWFVLLSTAAAFVLRRPLRVVF